MKILFKKAIDLFGTNVEVKNHMKKVKLGEMKKLILMVR